MIVGEVSDDDQLTVVESLAGKAGWKNMALGMQALMIALVRRNGGSVQISKDEFDRANEFMGGLEIEVKNNDSVLAIIVHEQLSEDRSVQ